ncbi:RNA-directed DNA polymerase, eukaryota, reverse transcriptase zinc-binding domain protein, partial [Tanacetum coccineum]
MKGSVNVDKTKNESNKRKFDGSHMEWENTDIDDCLNAEGSVTLVVDGQESKEMASFVNLRRAFANEVGFLVIFLFDSIVTGSEVDGSLTSMDRIRSWLYIHRFDKPSVNRACIDTPFPVSLSIDQKEDMERRISKEEVKRAVWDCGVDKSPGPDGFSFSFYRHFWPVIEKDVFEAVDYFFMGSILVNGSPMEEFQFFRGLKQGDPLSPFLFILIMESLHISFQRVVYAGLFTGIKINSIMNLSHLFYADDAIFLGQWSELNIDSLVRVLDCFFWASGLRINMYKSKIMGVNVEDGMVKNAASKLGCLVLKTPLTYLGSGRLRTPVQLEDPKSNKASWVKWNKVLTPKDKGGLGVSSLFALNRGLMLKWVWRFYSHKCSLWTKVIKAIYGEDGNLNKDVSGGVRTCWTSIVHEVRVLQGRGINVTDYIRLKLGNGENTRFWVDNWYEGGVIKELFPRMFALELNKNATVSSKLNASSLENSFRRKARSGIEEMQLNSLAEISRMATLVPCEDRYVWTLESDEVFSVASIRKEIDRNRFQDVSLPTRWVKSVPIKVMGSFRWLQFERRLIGIGFRMLVYRLVRQIMRKISSWWNIDYSDVNSYEEW